MQQASLMAEASRRSMTCAVKSVDLCNSQTCSHSLDGLLLLLQDMAAGTACCTTRS